MASLVCRSSRLSALLMRGAAPKRPDAAQCRTAVASASGAVLRKPAKISFGLLRITAVVLPFLYVGTLISKNFAALLEEHDIFVPEDDDDDD